MSSKQKKSVAATTETLIDAFASCAKWYGTNNNTHPLICLLQRNNKKQKGWIRLTANGENNKKVELTQSEISLFFFLLLSISGVTGLGVADKRDLLLDAFGVTKNQRNIRELLQPETFRKFVAKFFFTSGIKLNDHDPSSALNDDNPSAANATPVMMKTPNEEKSGDHNIVELVALYETPRVSDNEESDSDGEQQNDMNTTPAETTHVPIIRNLFDVDPTNDNSLLSDTNMRKRVAERQSPFLSPESIPAIAHRSKNRPVNRRVSFSTKQATTTEQEEAINGGAQLEEPTIQKEGDGVQESDVGIDNEDEPKDATTSLLLTPSLSALNNFDSKSALWLQTAAHRVVSKLADSKTGMAELKYLDRQQKTRTAKLVVAPLPRKGKKTVDENTKRRKINAQSKALKLHSLLDAICIDSEERDQVLQYYVEDHTDMKLVANKKVENKLSEIEAIVVRDYVGTSTNGLYRFARALKILLGIECFPPQLRQKVAQLELLAVPTECLYVDCNITKSARKLCLYLRCKNPALLLERMIAGSLVAGKQQRSIDISNYKNSVLVFVGLDRGGGDIYLGMRNGNRVAGNQADFCFPLAVLEDAAEGYDNAKNTFFAKGSVTEMMYQDLIDDAIHLIELLSISKRKLKTIADAQCIAVRFVADKDSYRFNHSTTKVWLRLGPDIAVDKVGAIRGAVNAENRERATAIVVPSLRGNNGGGMQQQEIKLVARLIVQESTGAVGLKMFNDDNRGQCLLTFLFERPLSVHKCSIKINCNLVRGFPSHDGKCAIMISGQSSAGSVMPCLRCIEDRSKFREYREWMHSYQPDLIPRPSDGNAVIRIGEYSNVECYKRFIQRTGLGMYKQNKAVNMDDKRAACSVVCEPCAIVNPTKESGGPMHICAGIVDHLIADTRTALRAIDKRGPLMCRLAELKSELDNFQGACTTDSEKLNKMHDTQYVKCINKASERLRQLTSKSVNPPPADEAVQEVKSYLDGVQTARFQHAQRSGFGTMNLIRKGAAEVSQSITTFLSSSATKNCCGVAEFVFNKAIEFTGAKYRKEHGGMSLSNSHSMLVVERYEAIAATVERTYCEHPDLRAEVLKVMRVFRRLADPCYRISLVLKSQAKMDACRIELLKASVCDYSVAFREEYPDRIPFPKLHWLECIVVNYAMTHGFVGIGSEEGFESTHNRLSWIKNLLVAMPFAKDRGTKMGQRHQVHLIPGVEDVWSKLNPPKKTRAPYNRKTENDSKLLGHLQYKDDETTPVGCTKLTSGNLIYDTWKEPYEFVEWGHATAEMREFLERNTRSLKNNEKFKNLIAYVS